MSDWGVYGNASPWMRKAYGVAQGLGLALRERAALFTSSSNSTPNAVLPTYRSCYLSRGGQDWLSRFDSELAARASGFRNQFDDLRSSWSFDAMLDKLAERGFEPVPFRSPDRPPAPVYLSAEWARQRYIMVNWLRFADTGTFPDFSAREAFARYQSSLDTPEERRVKAWVLAGESLTPSSGAVNHLSSVVSLVENTQMSEDVVTALLVSPKCHDPEDLLEIDIVNVSTSQEIFFDFGTGLRPGHYRLRADSEGYFWAARKYPSASVLPESGAIWQFFAMLPVARKFSYVQNQAAKFAFYDPCDDIEA